MGIFYQTDAGFFADGYGEPSEYHFIEVDGDGNDAFIDTVTEAKGE